MRPSRWLFVAGLGVTALAQADDEFEQHDVLPHEDHNSEWSEDMANTADELSDEVEEIIDEAGDSFGEYIDNLSDKDLYNEYLDPHNDVDDRDVQDSSSTTMPASMAAPCQHCASHAVSMEHCNLCNQPMSANEQPAERDFKPKPPKPEDLVSKIPAHATPGWGSTSSSRINGHRWEWTYVVTATDPTEFVVTYHDHHHHTSKAFGEYNPSERPHVTISASRNALDVLKAAEEHAATDKSPRAAGQDNLNLRRQILASAHGGPPEHASSGEVWTSTVEALGTHVVETGTVTNIDPTRYVANGKIGPLMWTGHGEIDKATSPPVTTETVEIAGQVLTLTVADAPMETVEPLARRIYEAVPTRVTPGQIYTHTSVENGDSITATIKVTATKPNTAFDVTMHSGTISRTCKAYINKKATPPVIVQTVTGAGVSFVQTETWGPRKAHAYLPHATQDTSHSTPKGSRVSKASSLATHVPHVSHTAHGSNGTLPKSKVHTVVQTHVKTRTIKASHHTVTMFKTMEDPEAVTQNPFMVTATRLSCHGNFSLPSATPQAMLYADSCSTAEVLNYRNHVRMAILRKMSLPELRDGFRHLSWAYIETLTRAVLDSDEELAEEEAASMAILCMLQKANKVDACPCDNRRMELLDPHLGVTTEFIARLGPNLSSTITPPATITRHGKPVVFALAEETSDSKSHSSRHKHHGSHKHLSLLTDHITEGPALQTMTVVLDNAPRVLDNGSHARPEFPRSEEDYMEQRAPECKDHHNKHKKECKIHKCMWRFLMPINITTVMPAVMAAGDGMFFDYFTYTTALSGNPHWGTSSTEGIYYPMGRNTTVNEHGCTKKTLTREAPPSTSTEDSMPRSVLHRLVDPMIHGDPWCQDRRTCYDFCDNEVRHSGFWHSKTAKVLLTIVAILGGLFLLGLLCCCALAFLHKRRKIRKAESAADPSMVSAVDPATGQSVDPSTVIVTSTAGPATAAAAGRSGTQNAGTLGRQAEEGRGRVHFPDSTATAVGAGAAGAAAGEKASGSEKAGGGEKASGGMSGEGTERGTGGEKEVKGGGQAGGNESGTAVTSEKAADEPGAEHVETVPAHDGADSRRTGSEMAGMGSMRGRRPIRQNDQGLL